MVGSILVLVWVPGQLEPLLGDLHPGEAQLGQLRPHATELVPETLMLQDSSYGSSIPAHLVYVRVEKLLIYSPLDLGYHYHEDNTDQRYCYHHLEAGHIRPGHELQEFEDDVELKFLPLQRVRSQEQEGLFVKDMITLCTIIFDRILSSPDWAGQCLE